MAKRDLAKIGIATTEQLERPLPAGIVVAARVALRKDDDGAEFNRVTRFDVVAVETPAPDPFAPVLDDAAEPNADGSALDDDGFDWRTGEQTAERNGVPPP